jgi:hypothetical protein
MDRNLKRMCTTATVVVLLACGGGASPARAQDGVFIDPGSPTAKEYEIPFESVRRGAEPGADPSASIQQGERNAAPFGEGITSTDRSEGPAGQGSSGEGSSSTGSSSDSNRGADRSERGQGGDGATEGGSTAKIVEAAASNPGAPPASASSTLLYVGAGVLVLALGAGAGVLLRRRRA